MIVEWNENALDRLADIYVAITPTERETVVRCVERTTARLGVDPGFFGESRGGIRRVWFNRPLMVVYDLLRGGGVLVVHVAFVGNDTDDP